MKSARVSQKLLESNVSPFGITDGVLKHLDSRYVCPNGVLDIPDEVHTIGEGAVGWHKDVRVVNLNNVQVIESRAFEHCIHLEKIDISGVSEVAMDAFNHNLSMKKVIFSSKLNNVPVGPLLVNHDTGEPVRRNISYYFRDSNGKLHTVLDAEANLGVIGLRVDGDFITGTNLCSIGTNLFSEEEVITFAVNRETDEIIWNIDKMLEVTKAKDYFEAIKKQGLNLRDLEGVKKLLLWHKILQDSPQKSAELPEEWIINALPCSETRIREFLGGMRKFMGLMHDVAFDNDKRVALFRRLMQNPKNRSLRYEPEIERFFARELSAYYSRGLDDKLLSTEWDSEKKGDILKLYYALGGFSQNANDKKIAQIMTTHLVNKYLDKFHEAFDGISLEIPYSRKGARMFVINALRAMVSSLHENHPNDNQPSCDEPSETPTGYATQDLLEMMQMMQENQEVLDDDQMRAMIDMVTMPPPAQPPKAPVKPKRIFPRTMDDMFKIAPILLGEYDILKKEFVKEKYELGRKIKQKHQELPNHDDEDFLPLFINLVSLIEKREAMELDIEWVKKYQEEHPIRILQGCEEMEPWLMKYGKTYTTAQSIKAQELYLKGKEASEKVFAQTEDDHNQPIYYEWIKPSDPRLYVAGVMANCCFRPGYAAESGLVAAALEKNVQCLLLYSSVTGEPIGLALAAYNGRRKAILFNNIEVSDAHEKHWDDIVDAIKRATNDQVQAMHERGEDLTDVQLGANNASGFNKCIRSSNLVLAKRNLPPREFMGEQNGSGYMIDAEKGQYALYSSQGKSFEKMP